MELFPSKLTLALALVIVTFSTKGHSDDTPQDFVDAHNEAREEVGVPPLEWDDEVAKYAQGYADKRALDCAAMHSNGPYGENLVVSPEDISAKDAVKLWVDEKAMYDHNSNTCVKGECHHYTQVVWGETTYVGCAKVRCKNGGTFVTCNYDPSGNYVDQKPF